MIDCVSETRPKDSGGGGGKTKEEIVQEKAKELLGKLPPNFEEPEIRSAIVKLAGPKALTDKGFNVPLNIFLF